MLLKFFLPFTEWDYMNIVYSVIATFIGFLALRWLGLFKTLARKLKNKKAVSTYKKILKNECNTLVVIGKRKGFSLNEVYVSLDLACSDLMADKRDGIQSEPKKFVLVGGPGAGKSTTAKNYVLEHLKNKSTLPFFIKLKDYNGTEPIENFLLQKITALSHSNPDALLKENLLKHNSLCVLDGLDEVRPHLRTKVCDEINNFYAKYFINSGRFIITCRKEAYRDLPLNISDVWEVRPLSDQQIKRFAKNWPLEYPNGKSEKTFFNDLLSSPRVMELTRSPLLLVGGLMHYTEANLGIPEERFQYLQTTAKWLISDWAKAQDHSPDQYKGVYDRILTSLAFSMHSKGLSEIKQEMAKEFIADLLPTFGYQAEDSDTILNNLIIKTGVLVRDGSSIFFSQFGLQEYFTSIELLNNIDISAVSKLTPIEWWREALLLCVAQQIDPTKILNYLFLDNPILAVAAVAECPTPSIHAQETAISIGLKLVDEKNEAIKGSIVPLLRKTRGNIEIHLCNELEARLKSNKEVSTLVGISLATAGTIAATNTLAKHPEIWDVCLSQAGYLSSNFENLLVEWIQNGSNFEGIKAADLLITRLTKDRLSQLVQIIPSLSSEKKEHLSRLLLKEISTTHTYNNPNINNPIELISLLVPNIPDTQTFSKEVLKTKLESNLEYFDEYRTFYDRPYLLPLLIGLFLKNKDKRCSSEEITDCFFKANQWFKNRKSYFMWLFSSFLFLSIFLHNHNIHFYAFLLLLSLFTFIFIQPNSRSPLTIFRYFMNLNTFSSHALFYCLGILSLLFYLDLYNLSFIGNGITIGTIGCSLLFSLFGLIFWLKNEPPFRIDLSPKNIRRQSRFTILLHYSNFILLLFYSGYVLFFTINPFVIILFKALLLAYLIWLVINMIILYYEWKKIRGTEQLMVKELDITVPTW